MLPKIKMEAVVLVVGEDKCSDIDRKFRLTEQFFVKDAAADIETNAAWIDPCIGIGGNGQMEIHRGDFVCGNFGGRELQKCIGTVRSVVDDIQRNMCHFCRKRCIDLGTNAWQRGILRKIWIVVKQQRKCLIRTNQKLQVGEIVSAANRFCE